MRKKAALHNLGCKVNAYEIEAMRQQLIEGGYEIVPFAPGADVYVINTCTVTNIADRKSRQMLHRAKKMNPSAIVAAVGCYAQIRGEEMEKDPAVDVVIGSGSKTELLRLLREAEAGKTGAVMAPVRGSGAVYEPMQIERSGEHTRAFLKVQDGCDQFCSYCIIPYARGTVRSRDAGEVVREVRLLATEGVREIVLNGIHLCSYGRDSGGSLLGLIRQVHEVEGIERIRLGSLEPGSVDEEFVRGVRALPKVCPHFHLSLQSGCSRTLQRMNRRYTAEQYREVCGILRTWYEAPALTTDIIVGFPGETEEDFEECRRFVEEISFFETHVFPYSRRAGTKAASMPDQVTEAVKRRRAAVLRDLCGRKRELYLQQFCGQTVEVLFEEQTTIDGIDWWTGHGRRYQRVLAASEEDLINRVLPITAQGVLQGEYLLGTVGTE